MPLTSKGREIKSAMTSEYGPEKGESVFYASENAGKIRGVCKDVSPAALKSEADDYYRKAQSASPKDAANLFWIAAIFYHDSGDRAKAAECREKADKLRSGSRANDSDRRGRLHQALDSMLDEVLDKRARRQLRVMRGQPVDARS
jgi:hypothetical protein